MVVRVYDASGGNKVAGVLWQETGKGEKQAMGWSEQVFRMFVKAF